MAVYVPLMNPLRFYDSTKVPDYSSYFPLIDNTTQRVKYQEGIYAQEYWYKDFLINTAITLQFEMTGLSDENITVTLPDSTTTELTPTDISPAGWTGDTVNRYAFTPTQAGIHSMSFNEGNLVSDVFYVSSALKLRKKLIKIEYRNTENQYGMVFYDTGTVKYTGLTYFTGIIKPVAGYDISVFKTYSGGIGKTNSTPVRNYLLTLTDIHISYKENIDHIFACDYIKINGQEFQNENAPEISEKDKLDLIDININLTMTSNDYYVKNL